MSHGCASAGPPVRSGASLGPLALLCLAVAALSAQDAPPADPPQPPTFVTATQYVRVDLYVTRDDTLVDDLGLEEVALFEDGVPQTIDSFERIAFRTPDPFEPPIEPRTLAASRRLAADARSRVFVVFLDTAHSSYVGSLPGSDAQRRFPILRQLQAALGPDDLVAIMTEKMRPEDMSFSRGVDALATLEGDWFAPYSVINPDPHEPYDDTELLYEACYPPGIVGTARAMHARRREQLVFNALEALAGYLGDLREERKTVLLVTDGWLVYLPTPDLIAPPRGGMPLLPEPPIGGPGRTPGRGTRWTERGVVTVSPAEERTCEADRLALANLDHSRRVDEIINRANTANVSFYPVAARGLTTATPSMLMPVGRQSALTPAGVAAMRRNAPYQNHTPLEVQGVLRELAEQTDGYAVVNTNNLTGGMQRMMADSAAYYLLGYESTNPVLDGSYRRISVQVDRPEVRVRARRGYIAAPVSRPTDVGRPATPRAVDPVEAALNRVANTNVRIPLHVRDAVWGAIAAAGGSAGGFWLVGDIDAQFRRGATWTGAVAQVIVLTAGGDEVFRSRNEVAPPGPAIAVRVPETGVLPPGDYTVRLEVDAGAPVGRLYETRRVTIPSEAAPLGQPVLWRRGPSTGFQPVPTADPRFRRTERLRLELAAPGDGPVAARLLDRTGAPLPVPVIVSERADASDGLRWAVLDLTLAPLAPADYVIETAQGTATRMTAFSLVP